jgi:hypothetical protein
MSDELYRWTVDGLLLKCMNEEHARIAMGEVPEGSCWDISVSPQNEVVAQEIWSILADYGGGLHQVPEGV